jgi:hypothetical protein
VVVSLIDGSDGSVLTHAGTGQGLTSLREILYRGDVPDYVREAMASRKIVVRRNPAWSFRVCRDEVESG